MKLIQSRDNVFFKSLKRLAESGRERKKMGQTLLDGVHLVAAYEAQWGPVDTLIIAESALANGEVAAYVAGREVVCLADVLMRELGLVDTPSGLLALIALPANAAAVDPGKDAVLLDGIQDPGNVGTLLRTAAAAGVSQVLLAPGCAAVWSPKVLRAGQGAHFVLNLFEDVDLADFMARYQGTTAVTCLDASEALFSAVWTSPLAWVFGSEGAGVRRELMAMAGLRLHIPMPGAVESLNVGAAAAICLFEAVRRKAQP